MRSYFLTACLGAMLIVCVASHAAEVPLDYEQAIARVRQLSGEGRYAEAEMVLRQLEQHYPNNPEVAAFIGRLAAWQKQYDTAFVYLRCSLAQRHDHELSRLLERVETFMQLEQATSWERAGETSRALVVLEQLCSQRREPYESCRRLGLLQLKSGEADAAYRTFSRLRSQYADDSDLVLMSIRSLGASGRQADALEQLGELPADWQRRSDSVALRDELVLAMERMRRQKQQQELEQLLLAGDLNGARSFFESLVQQEQVDLELAEPALPYRLRQQNVRLGMLFADDSRGMPLEKQLDLALTYRMPGLTTVLQGGWVSRYGEHDAQLGGELYINLSEDRRRTLMLAGFFAPSASFLPHYALKAELGQAVGRWELALGGTRLAFADEAVHLVTPRLSWYLPNGWSLAEQLHVVVENGTVSSHTSVMWQPTYRVSSKLGVTIGETGERLGDARDLERFFTIGGRVESEYRVTPLVSMGAEFFYENRERLYEKTGGGLFIRRWW